MDKGTSGPAAQISNGNSNNINGPIVSQIPNSYHPLSSYGLPKDVLPPNSNIAAGNQSIVSGSFIGEITEPFWVQNQITNDSYNWCEPDDIFLNEAKKIISITDKRIFWEMIKAIVELPQLSALCKNSVIKTPRDITNVLKRIENRYLWISDAPLCLPAQIAGELIAAAYVIQQPMDKKE